jgi:thiol-disulfide isomerase/thioredoxin
MKKSTKLVTICGILGLLLVLNVGTGLAHTTKSTGQLFGTEFSVAGMVCEDCAKSAQQLLAQIPGVTRATVDLESEAAVVRSTRDLPREEIEEALGTMGFEARFPGDVILEALSDEEKANLDIKMASRGEAIRLAEHLAPGKVTIFDYYADWCGPCHLLSPKLERLLLKYPDLALRTVDIVGWETEAAKQATNEFDLPGLPYVTLYDRDGSLLGQVQGNRVEKVEEIIEKALNR